MQVQSILWEDSFAAYAYSRGVCLLEIFFIVFKLENNKNSDGQMWQLYAYAANESTHINLHHARVVSHVCALLSLTNANYVSRSINGLRDERTQILGYLIKKRKILFVIDYLVKEEVPV